ncbi:MAG: NAD(P)-dependent oxidoreductase [Halobacteriaceae archaeon]
MHVLLLGATGRIGQRTASELLDRGHMVTGVSRSGDAAGIEDESFVAVTGDATEPGDVAKLATAHDAVVSALEPGEDESPERLVPMVEATVAGLRRADVDRLVWTGGAGGLHVGPDTLLVDTPDFPDEWEGLARAAIDAYEVLSEAEDLRWSYVAPAALIEPGERTGEYRTAERELVADEDGDSFISMADFAVALADELEEGRAVHTYLGTGY